MVTFSRHQGMSPTVEPLEDQVSLFRSGAGALPSDLKQLSRRNGSYCWQQWQHQQNSCKSCREIYPVSVQDSDSSGAMIAEAKKSSWSGCSNIRLEWNPVIKHICQSCFFGTCSEKCNQLQSCKFCRISSASNETFATKQQEQSDVQVCVYWHNETRIEWQFVSSQ